MNVRHLIRLKVKNYIIRCFIVFAFKHLHWKIPNIIDYELAIYSYFVSDRSQYIDMY